MWLTDGTCGTILSDQQPDSVASEVRCAGMTEDKRVLNMQTVRRLPMYLYFLKQLRQTGREYVSSAHIAEELGLEPIVVRKDLAIAGNLGKPRIGYSIDVLVGMIEGFLGWNNVSDAFLFGAGALGSALLGYQGFSGHGLNIVAAFDVDPAKIGTVIHDKHVLSMDRLADLAERMHVHLGVLCVPAAAAQVVCNEAVAAGIRGIWNFTPVKLKVPADVVVQREDLAAGLAMLSCKLMTRVGAPSAAK